MPLYSSSTSTPLPHLRHLCGDNSAFHIRLRTSTMSWGKVQVTAVRGTGVDCLSACAIGKRWCRGNVPFLSLPESCPSWVSICLCSGPPELDSLPISEPARSRLH